MKSFFKKLLCLHLNWTNEATYFWQFDYFKSKAGYEDWRTGEKWFTCKSCFKDKNFGYRNLPINYGH